MLTRVPGRKALKSRFHASVCLGMMPERWRTICRRQADGYQLLARRKAPPAQAGRALGPRTSPRGYGPPFRHKQAELLE